MCCIDKLSTSHLESKSLNDSVHINLDYSALKNLHIKFCVILKTFPMHTIFAFVILICCFRHSHMRS